MSLTQETGQGLAVVVGSQSQQGKCLLPGRLVSLKTIPSPLWGGVGWGGEQGCWLAGTKQGDGGKGALLAGMWSFPSPLCQARPPKFSLSPSSRSPPERLLFRRCVYQGCVVRGC